MTARSDPEQKRRRSPGWIVVLGILLVAAVVGWISIWGFPWRQSEAEQAREVLEPFILALREHDFEAACDLLAETAPPMRAGSSGCPGLLRKSNAGIGWSYQLLDGISTRVEGHERGKILVAAWDAQAALFDAGPTYRFVLLREDGALRIERFFGRF